MKDIRIFRIYYDWYEGEHEETLLGKGVSEEEFEKDMGEAVSFATSLIGKEAEMGDYLGKGYSVECLPEYYEQILWFLTKKKGYINCDFDMKARYQISEGFPDRIIARKRIETLEWKELKIHCTEKAKSLNITKSNNIITNENNNRRTALAESNARKPKRSQHNKGAFKKSRDKLQAGI